MSAQIHRRLVTALSSVASGTLVFAGLLVGCGESDPVDEVSTAAPVEAVEPAVLSLDAAVMQDDLQAIQAHIAAGHSVNTKTMMGDTPLHIAAAMGRLSAAELLVDAGAELEVLNGAGVTPLFNAAFFGHVEVLQRLIDAGGNKDVTDQAGTPIRQIMEMPWEQMRPVYEMVHSSVGLPFDEDRIEGARPRIVEMLR